MREERALRSPLPPKYAQQEAKQSRQCWHPEVQYKGSANAAFHILFGVASDRAIIALEAINIVFVFDRVAMKCPPFLTKTKNMRPLEDVNIVFVFDLFP